MSAVRHLEATPEVVAEVQTVTPELASKWLETNEGNRKVREQLVNRLARDMRAGRWQVTGEGIKFDRDGRLVDGQHRLWAVVQSEATIDILVVHNLDRDTRLVMDTGGKRRGADALAMAGYTHTALLASTAALGLHLERGGAVMLRKSVGSDAYSHQEILDWVERHPTIHPSVAFAQSALHKTVPLLPTPMAYAHWQMAQVDAEAAERFFREMTTMSLNGQSDPRLTLMRWGTRVKDNRERLSHTVTLSVLYRTWNAWRKGKRLTYIRIEADGKPVGIPTLV